MFWAIAFPLYQELPIYVPALLERFMRKHILMFINKHAFSINLQGWGRSGSVLTHVVWPQQGHMKYWVNAICVRQLHVHSNPTQLPGQEMAQ